MKKNWHLTSVAFLIFLCFFTSCTVNKSAGSSSLINKTISFYVEKIGGKFDEDVLHKNISFSFHSNGNYKATIDGQLFQEGDYSYDYSGNKGNLLISYSDKSNIFEYELYLIFETNTSGKWSGVYSNNPGIKKAEGGTFELKN